MKKFLSVLGALSLTVSSAATVVACGDTNQKENNDKPGETPKDDHVIDKEIHQLATERAQSLMIADQFNLSQKETYNSVNKNQTRYNELFNETSTKNLNLANSEIGAPGGILNEFIPEDFDLKDYLKDIKLPGGIDLGGVFEGTGIEQIETVLNLLGLFTADLSSVFSLLFPILGGLEINFDIADIFSSMIESIKNSLQPENIQPVFNAMKVGTDLTRFANIPAPTIENPENTTSLTIRGLYTGVIMGLVEGLRYGIEPDYEGLDLVTTLSTLEKFSLNTNNNLFAHAINSLYDYIESGTINNFSLEYNASKVIESFFTSITILNTILSIYRTPEINFDKVDEEGNPVDQSLHLFSETVENNQYVASQGSALLKDLTIDSNNEGEEEKEVRNLKGLNYGELLANIQYYLGNGQYEFQKLVYILLYGGKEGSNSNPSPFFVAIIRIANKFADQIYLIMPFFVKVFLEPLVNNQRLQLGNLFSSLGFISRIIKNAINAIEPGLSDKLETMLPLIDDYFGDKPLTTLYSGELRGILNVVEDLIGADTVQSAISGINELIGEEAPLNVETLLTKVKLSKIIGLANSSNPNIPNYGSYYTNKTIRELLVELQEAFPIPINATNKELGDYYLDFEILESLINQLLFDSETEKSLLNQILELVKTVSSEDPIQFSKIFELLGSIDSETIKVDSFLGKLIIFLSPKATISKENEEEVFKTNQLTGHNHFSWLLNGITKILPNLIQPDEIADFVTDILNNKNIFKPVQEILTNVGTWFENSNELKSYTFNIFFNPNEVSFADGTKLTGDIVEYTFTINRDNPTDNFSFTDAVKTLIN